ncbi:MAG: radical SAM protein [Syntrophales bacterium]
MKGSGEIDLLLINPGNRNKAYQSLGDDLAAIEPPVWSGLIAQFIRNHGFSVDIIDANADTLSIEETVIAIQNRKPLLTAIVAYGHNPSASTQVMPAAGAICSALKEDSPEFKTILLGGHVAALPERTLAEENATFVAGGEGSYTLLDLLKVLKSNSRQYGNVRGLWYRDDGKIKSTPPAPLVTSLDEEMPGIAWDLLPMDKYRAHNWHCFETLVRQPYAAIYTTLGCPFHCQFCCIQAPFRDGEAVSGYKPGVSSYRLWKPESVISQIDILVNKYNVRNIKITDEIFALRPKHVIEICDLIISRNYDLNIWAYARVDTLTEVLLEKMKRAGIHWLALGIESASARVRDDTHKGYRQDRILQSVNLIKNIDVNIVGNYIFGLPEDDSDSMQETLDLALEINAEWANFYCAMAYPGSRLYEQALQEGWKLPDNWGAYSQYAEDTLPLPTRYLSAGDVLRFRDNAFQLYFNSASYLEMIRKKFGQETINHIKAMSSKSIKRKYAGS